MPLFFAIDPSAASKLKNQGRWDASDADDATWSLNKS
jgi:hypothetical protein